MNNITSDNTCSKLRETFTRWGIPEVIVSDNGPQLVSEKCETFLRNNGIKHIASSPFHPATNGAAENAVKSFKKGLKAALMDEKNRNTDIDILISRYLLAYRNSIHGTTNETPAFLMLGRKLRTLFDLVKPNTRELMENRKEKQSQNKRGKEYRNLELGDRVIARDYRNINNKGWQEGVITEIKGKKNYVCKTTEGLLWRRHIDQIKKIQVKAEMEEKIQDEVPTNSYIRKAPSKNISNSNYINNPDPYLSSKAQISDRPRREIRKPMRFQD